MRGHGDNPPDDSVPAPPSTLVTGHNKDRGDASATRSLLGTLRILPRGVWVMGFGSLFMDSSSELIHALLPIFMSTVLGASMATIGVVEGVAEATASITKVFSGVFSDYLRHRKWVVVSGYALAALSKPLFALAGSIGVVFAARFIDRIGKGIRGAPRDALLADITPAPLRGAAYGLRQALDSVGAFLGPLAAVALMLLLSQNIRAVMWAAVAPAIVTVGLLSFYLSDRRGRQDATKPGSAFSFAELKRLPYRYWRVVAVGAVFTLARFSEAFLILRAQNVGLPITYAPLVMIVMNVFYAAFAYPAGAAADRMSRRRLLSLGLVLLIGADALLATAASTRTVLVGTALWGLHMALTQGLLAKLVADTAPQPLRATAFGLFNVISGAALLLASVVAGGLWDLSGPAATFTAGGIFATVALAGLLLGPTLGRKRRQDAAA